MKKNRLSVLGDYAGQIGVKYLKASDLKDKPPLVLTIKAVDTRELKGIKKLVLSFNEIPNQLVLNRTNVAYLRERLGANTPISQLVGHKITIASVPVQYSNNVVSGIRIMAVE